MAPGVPDNARCAQARGASNQIQMLTRRRSMHSRQILLIACGVVSLSALPVAYGEQVSSAQHTVTVKYRSGEVEHYVVVWTGDVNMTVHEDGGPAVPFSGHFVDDRRCQWNIAGGITRQVFLVSRTGQQYASPSLARVYNQAQQNQGSSF